MRRWQTLNMSNIQPMGLEQHQHQSASASVGRETKKVKDYSSIINQADIGPLSYTTSVMCIDMCVSREEQGGSVIPIPLQKKASAPYYRQTLFPFKMRSFYAKQKKQHKLPSIQGKRKRKCAFIFCIHIPPKENS